MKKHLLLLLLCSALLIENSYAAEVQKFGTATVKQLSTLSKLIDPTQDAIIIQHIGILNKNERGNLQIGELNAISKSMLFASSNYTYEAIFEKRILITSENGLELANQEFIYDEEFKITSLEAYSYTLENKKITKSSISKDMVNTYQFDNKKNATRFTIPNVKIGSIIEYRYKINLSFIPTWYFQEEYPTLYSSFSVSLPDLGQYYINQSGQLSIKRTDSSHEVSSTYNTPKGEIRIATVYNDLHFEAENIPLYKFEPMLWSNNDYIAKVDFEYYPNSKTTTAKEQFVRDNWGGFETLLKESKFTGDLNFFNPLKKEYSELLSGLQETSDTLGITFDFVKSKVNWNTRYSFNPENTVQAIKEGKGNNAQINNILLSLIKSAGYETFPILLCTRSNGKMQNAYPSLNQINTFIVGVKTAEGIVVMDGSSAHESKNVLPLELQVETARIFSDKIDQKWINLMAFNKNSEQEFYTGTIDASGTLNINYKATYVNTCASQFKTNYYSEKDSLSYIKNLETLNNLKVHSYSINGLERNSNKVSINAAISYQLEEKNNIIAINPILFDIFQNDFTDATRNNPIQLEYATTKSVSYVFTIPDGYSLLELPRSERIMYNDKVKCDYLITENQNRIMFNYKFLLNQVEFDASEYDNLKNYFGKISSIGNNVILIKKNDN